MVELLVLLGDLHPVFLDPNNPLTRGPWSAVALHLGNQMSKFFSQLCNKMWLNHPSTLPVSRELDQTTQIVSQFLRHLDCESLFLEVLYKGLECFGVSDTKVIINVHGSIHCPIIRTLYHETWISKSALELNVLEDHDELLPPLSCSLH